MDSLIQDYYSKKYEFPTYKDLLEKYWHNNVEYEWGSFTIEDETAKKSEKHDQNMS